MPPHFKGPCRETVPPTLCALSFRHASPLNAGSLEPDVVKIRNWIVQSFVLRA
jgi:hypothetical protein